MPMRESTDALEQRRNVVLDRNGITHAHQLARKIAQGDRELVRMLQEEGIRLHVGTHERQGFYRHHPEASRQQK